MVKKNNKPKNTNEIFLINDGTVYFKLKGKWHGENTNAMVSLDKWDVVSKYVWYLGKSGYPICYELSKISLHRFIYFLILGSMPPKHLYIDHIDRNKLNNTNENLRMVTPQENSFNRTTNTNKKGVRKISENNYSCIITKNGIKHEIKNIESETQAAEIYNMMAEELFGEFAAPNIIN